MRVTDAFMRAVLEDRRVGAPRPHRRERARDGPRPGPHEEGHRGGVAVRRPGHAVRHHRSTRWHTCPNTDRINASNPCSEYMFLDDSACNLASLNLMHFRTATVSSTSRRSSTPSTSPSWRRRSWSRTRGTPPRRSARPARSTGPLGLGYANLGRAPHGERAALRLRRRARLRGGHHRAHDRRGVRDERPHRGADRARSPATRRTASRSWASSASTRSTSTGSTRPSPTPRVLAAARDAWADALRTGSASGYRNAQVTVLAPTGTIGFMMDCDTTGIEPDIALVKYKKLVGGGMLKIVNNTVPLALQKLGYSQEAISADPPVHRRDGDHRGRAGARPRAPPRLRLRLQAAQRHAVHPRTWATSG